jgi:hypothetical protein
MKRAKGALSLSLAAEEAEFLCSICVCFLLNISLGYKRHIGVFSPLTVCRCFMCDTPQHAVCLQVFFYM